MVRRPDGTDVGEAVVRSLLAGQHPDLAGRPLVRFDAGLDNLLWRLVAIGIEGSPT